MPNNYELLCDCDTILVDLCIAHVGSNSKFIQANLG